MLKGLQNFGETLINQIACRPKNVRYLLGGINHTGCSMYLCSVSTFGNTECEDE